MRVEVGLCVGRVRNHQEGGPLEQYHLVRVADAAELVQVRRKEFDVGDEVGDDRTKMKKGGLVVD